MNKTKLKYPRCHSEQLYKFGLDKQVNQKYQCKKCRRQFAPESVSTPKESKYSKCPNIGRLLSCIMLISITIAINVEIKSVTM